MTVLVTGGTGVLGRRVVERLVARGTSVRVLSRKPPVPSPFEWVTGDLYAGVGIDAAVSGVDTIVHCATQFTRHRKDRTAARRLIVAAKAAREPHLIYVSIVGIERIPYPYYRTKLTVEQLIEQSGLPWTILRVTQFHQLFEIFARTLARSPVVPVPAGFKSQPIDPRDVAEGLIELTDGPARGRVPDMGGPEVWTMRDLIQACLTAQGKRRLVLPVPIPGRVGRAYRAGYNLTPDHAVDRHPFGEFVKRADRS